MFRVSGSPHSKQLRLEVIHDRVRRFGFRHARYDEVAEGLRMAECVTGERLLDAETLSYVDSVTQMSNWVSGEPVDGFLVAAPLSQLGVEALLEDRFDVARPLKIWLSTRGRECAGLYIGIIAGQSDASRRQLLMMISMLRSDVFADVYCFARGVTDEGCRAMRSMGMTPYPTEASRLFVQMPRPAKGEVAA